MKTLIITLFSAIALVSTSAAAKADDKPSSHVIVNNTVNQYIDAVTKGHTENLEGLFANKFQQNIQGTSGISIFNKEQIAGFLKGNKDITQQCSTSYSIVEENQDCSIAKVEMKYDNFSKVEYVTLCREGDRWKISEIVSTFSK